jgi:hypothetical protein
LPGVIIGLVRTPSVEPKDFLRWTVAEAGDALLEFGDTVETMSCGRGSMAGTPGAVRFDALIWAGSGGEDVDALLGGAEKSGVLDSWTVFTLGGQRGFERRSVKTPMEHPDDPFSGLPGLTVPGMKKVVFHGRRDDITVPAYRSIFRDHLALTEIHMAHARRYWQREVDASHGPSLLPADGVSEFLTANWDEITDLYDNPESAEVVGADSSRFIDRATACTLFGITHVRLSDRPRRHS